MICIQQPNFYAVSKKKKEEKSVKSNLFNLLIKFIFIIIEGICHMLYPNVFFISSLETFTTLSSYHADHIGQWVINVVLKQRQSQKNCLKVNTKWLFFARRVFIHPIHDPLLNSYHSQPSPKKSLPSSQLSLLCFKISKACQLLSKY